MEKMLVKYVRNTNGHKVGVVVATAKNEIGWSLCNHKDQWDNETGIMIAVARAKQVEIPSSVKTCVDDMEKRAIRYFKKERRGFLKRRKSEGAN